MSVGDGTTFTGNVSGVDDRTTYQKLMTNQAFQAQIFWAAFDKKPFFKALGLQTFGVEALQDLGRFGIAMQGGGNKTMIRFSGGTSFAGSIFATTNDGFIASERMANINPSFTEGGDSWIYAWHQLLNVEGVPEVDLQDNQANKNLDILEHKTSMVMNKHVENMSQHIIGSTSAPQYGTLGPNALKSDLPNLISVTQTATVGAIATTNSFWQNKLKEIASLGGGGEMDRPLQMRRAMLKVRNDASVPAEGRGRYLMVGTQGASQYYDRLMYADQKERGVMVANGAYDTVGIEHQSFVGAPLIWDPDVTVPVGATASTECIYGIDTDNYFVSLHKNNHFDLHGGWEGPRVHDLQRFNQLLVSTRFTPGVSSRRTHFVCYDMPANGD